MFTGGTRNSEQAAAAGEKTDFSDLSASFLIREGVAHNDDLLAKSPFLRLTGAGDIDIAAGSLNYLAKAAAVATSIGQGGKDLANTRGLTLPVRASGPFTALKYKLEFGSAFSDSARQQVEAKKEELKGKLKDQIKSRLQRATEPAGETAPTTGGGSPPPSRPEDKLKEKLKKLF
jgi:AsmA protein